MKTIARLAIALAIAAGTGCQGRDQARPSAGDLPARPPQGPVPEPSVAPPSAAPPLAGPPPTQAARPGQPDAPPPSKEYAGDIAKLCDVVRLSGAEAESPEDRRLPVASWLAANLATAESRQFLAQIQPLEGANKAEALDAEARRVGLTGCALAAEWRAPPTR